MTGEREQLGGFARHDHVVAIERKRVVRRAEGLVSDRPGDGPRLGPPGRQDARRRVFEHAISDRDPRPFVGEPTVRRPAVEVALAVASVAEHHDPTTPHPLVEQGHVTGGERVRRSLGLAAQEEQQRAELREVGPREVGIEAPVLDSVPRVRPRAGRAVQDDGIGEREIEQQHASRLGLARGEQKRGDQADGGAGG